MRPEKKSLPRCRYSGRKNRRIGRHLRQKPKNEYDNGNNDHREQRLPPARGEDREDNRYVEESRNREETERKRKEEAESPATKGRKADPKWMTHKEVCEALDISHRTLQRYRSTGALPYKTLGKKTYYSEEDVLTFLSEHVKDFRKEDIAFYKARIHNFFNK